VGKSQGGETKSRRKYLKLARMDFILRITRGFEYQQFVQIKCQLDATDEFFYCRSYCLLNMFRVPLCPISGALEYYTSGCCLSYFAAARKPGTQPSTPHCTDNLKTKAPNTTGSNHLHNTLELLMMGIKVPETC
jgi:hypothetical protein